MGDTDGHVRIGDRERAALDARLQHAHGEGRLTLQEYEERAAQAWKATTRAELDALTTDLPPEAPGTAVAVPDRGSSREVLVRRAQRFGTALGVVVLAGAALWGGSRLVGGADDGVVVFSSRDVPVAAADDRVELGVLFGSLDVVVPEDARVVIEGSTVFASVECEAACTGPGTREVVVDVSGAFGSVDVLTVAEAAADEQDDDEDDD